MELPFTEEPSSWEAARENIPDGLYKIIEFHEDNMKHGEPGAKNPTNDTAKTNTPSPKQRDLSYIQRNEAKFCDEYDNDKKVSPLYKIE